MAGISWKKFYESVWDWSPKQQQRALDQLTGYGPSEEITEAAEALEDRAAKQLLLGALEAGVTFSPEDLLDLSGFAEEEVLVSLAKSCRPPLSPAQLAETAECMDEQSADTLILWALDKGMLFTPRQVLDLDCTLSEEVLSRMALHTSSPFSREEQEEIWGGVSDSVFESICRGSGFNVIEEQEEELPEDDWEEEPGEDWDEPAPEPRLGLLGYLGIAAITDKVMDLLLDDRDKKD